MDNLIVSVLGHSNSGKSTTWNNLFGREVRTGTELRRLYLKPNQYVEVFLVSGSPEERETYVGEIIGEQEPRIVLCSMQYRRDVLTTIDFFTERHYSLYTQWLNPGYHDQNETSMFDYLGIWNYLNSKNATLLIENGKLDTNARVQRICEFIFGWATYRDLIITE